MSFKQFILASTLVAVSSVAVHAEAPKAVWGTWGFDLSTMNKSVKPGDDFFRYANGTWLKTAQIPGDRTFNGVDLIIDEKYLKPRLRAIATDPAGAKAPVGTPARRVADLYASFMDTKSIEAKGLNPVKPYLDAITAIQTRDQLSEVIAQDFRRGITVPFGGYVDIDSKRPDRYIMRFYQNGLSFSDREYYLKDTAEFKELKAKFKAHVAKILTLAGSADATAQAELVLALETEIAKAHWPVEKSRDDELTYNLWKNTDFAAKAPGVNWVNVFKITGLGGKTEFLVSQPDTMTALAKLIANAPLDQWKAYLRYQTIVWAANTLPKAIDDETFGFYGTVVRGQKVQLERSKRGLNLLDSLLGDEVGHVYVDKYFPTDAKAQIQVLVGNFRKALEAKIQNAKWMSASTKTEALAKLGTMGAKLGYPDKWKDYSKLVIARDDLFGNTLRAVEWTYDYEINKIGKPIDPTVWFMNAQENNAYYSPQRNEIVFPAGILQPPYFDVNADLAVNYGSIGATIGHEMGHGFDDQGRKSDSKGRLRDWWTKEDAARYTVEAERLVKQYSAYSPVKGIFLNGKQTQGENIADLAGLIVAYDAYKLALNGKPAPVLDGLTGDQRFFLAYAQSWMTKYTDERLRDLALSNVHSPAEYRVSGVVRNFDVWYTAFDVKPGDKMYLKPEDRVRPW